MCPEITFFPISDKQTAVQRGYGDAVCGFRRLKDCDKVLIREVPGVTVMMGTREA